MSLERVNGFIRLMERAPSGMLTPVEIVRHGLVSPEELRGPEDPAERESLERQGRRRWWSYGKVSLPEGSHGNTPLAPVDAVGHIELATPVASAWFFSTCPVIQAVLGLADDELGGIIYRKTYVVLDPGEQEVRPLEAIDEDRVCDLRSRAKKGADRAFFVETGGTAIRELLRRVDPEALAGELRAKAAAERDPDEGRALADRLAIVELFRRRTSSGGSRRRLEWMVMDALPVIPRPDDAAWRSHLGSRYGRIISRCNQLRKLEAHHAPGVILENARSMVQKGVDVLLDDAHRWIPERSTAED